MTYSFLGLGKPIAAVNNILKTRIMSFHRDNPDRTLPLEPGGIFASDISMAAAFAGDNNMCVYMSIDELLQKSDIIFIFLTDKALKNISLTLGKHLIKGKIFCHFSGGYFADILDFNSANTYLSMYLPYFTKDNEGHTISPHILAEGYGKNIDRLMEVFSELKINITFITAEEKLMYLTAVNLAKDMPLVLKETAKRLAGYALASGPDTSRELVHMLTETPSELNSYNSMEARDADFVSRQFDILKSVGIEDITNLYGSLVKIHSQISGPDDALNRISNLAQRALDKK